MDNYREFKTRCDPGFGHLLFYFVANQELYSRQRYGHLSISQNSLKPNSGQLLPTPYSQKEKRRLVNTPKGFSQVHSHVAMAPSFAIISIFTFMHLPLSFIILLFQPFIHFNIYNICLINITNIIL